jgi:hypothetical protein
MMTASSFCRRSISRAALALVFAVVAYSAPAQIIQGLQSRSNLSVYGTLPANVTPDYGYYAPVLFGYSLGGFLQTPYFVGAEVRGQIQRRLNAQHQESALIGPRVAMHFGRLNPYASFLIGAGNGWRFLEPPILGAKQVKPIEDIGTQWTILGGVDFKLNHHFSARVGEVSFSKLYLKQWNLTPVNFTAGVVYRIN